MADEDTLDQTTDTQDLQTDGNWYDGLPNDVRAHPAITKYKSVEDLAKGHLSAQELIGKKGVIVPDEHSSDEVKQNFYKAIGRPEKPEEYALRDVDVPQGMPKANDEELGQFKQKAHEMGLSTAQVADLHEWYMHRNIDTYNGIIKQQEQAKQDAETKLRGEWGTAYDKNVDIAQKTINRFADKDISAVIESGLGNDPRFVRLMASIGSKLSEDVLVDGSRTPAMTPTDAMSEAKKLMAHEGYLNMHHPEHDAIVRRVSDLYKMAIPEKKG